MGKESWYSREGLRLVILALPFIFLLLFWQDLPAQIAFNRNAAGVPEQEGSKLHLVVLAVGNVALYSLFLLLQVFKKEISHTTSWRILQLLCHQLLTTTFFIVAYRALNYRLAPTLMLQYGFITLCLVLGSFLGSLPRNSTVGIRFSWTLADEGIWRSTHCFAAQLWVYTSLLMLLFTGWQQHTWVFPLYVVLLLLVPTAYAYLVYRRRHQSPAPPKK